MKLRPLFDKVIIEREQLVAKNSTIIIPEDAAKRNAPTRGVIVAVGPDANEDIYNTKVGVGDKVIFGRHAGTEIKDGDIEYYILTSGDILAIINEDEEE